MVGWLYWDMIGAGRKNLSQQIDHEITRLIGHYQNGGVLLLDQELRSRLDAVHRGWLYQLSDSQGKTITGNLLAQPQGVDNNPRQRHFSYDIEVPFSGEKIERYAQGRSLRLPNNLHLFVGRDSDIISRLEQWLLTSLFWGLALIIGVGFCGGVLTSRRFLSRVDTINTTSHDFMAGNFSCRIKTTGSGDELDRLAAELNMMLERIEELMGAMRSVADNIAHDLKSPLNRLRNRIEAVLVHRPDPGQVHTVLAETLIEIDHIIGIFNALLEISRTEADRLALHDTPGEDLVALITDVVELYHPVAEEYGFTLSYDLPPAPCLIHCKRALLNQALSNLIENAMAALRSNPTTGADPSIRITADCTRHALTLAVIDNGPGIPPSKRGEVIKRFFRLERSRNSPGSGLGLSLVVAVAHYHGGQFRFADNDAGTTAILLLPPTLIVNKP